MQAVQQLRYLSSADLEALSLSADAVAAAVEAIFIRKAAGRAVLKPKSSITPSPGNVVEAMLGVDLDSERAAVKWVSVATKNKELGLPGIQALLVLSETRSGQPLVLMNAAAITGIRTAACTAVAAKYLARKDSQRIGFVGAGLQARTHLEALRTVLPQLKEVTVYAGSSPTADAFAAHARAAGFEASTTQKAEDAVRSQDLIITTIPPAAGLVPFLDLGWVEKGAFVSAVDLGRSWAGENFASTFEVIATDDVAQSKDRIAVGKMISCERFDCDIGELGLGRHPGRSNERQRTVLLFAGTALADLAAAMLVAEEAVRNNSGTCLPI